MLIAQKSKAGVTLYFKDSLVLGIWHRNLVIPVAACILAQNGVRLSTHWDRDQMTAIFQMTFFKCIFLNEHISISIKIPLKFVPEGPINNILTLVQKMAWRRSSDKALSEPVVVYLNYSVSMC